MTVSERWKHIPMPSRPRCHCATSGERCACSAPCLEHAAFGSAPWPAPEPPTDPCGAYWHSDWWRFECELPKGHSGDHSRRHYLGPPVNYDPTAAPAAPEAP